MDCSLSGSSVYGILQARIIDIENRLMDMGMGKGRGEEGEGRMYGESNMETYINICKIDSKWEFPVGHRELKPVLCDNLEVWDEVEDRDIQEGGDIRITTADSC